MSKNTHLEHLEDELINNGYDGGINAIRFLESLRDMLGTAASGTRITTKWDGAPAIICGTDPETGLFFVGTKSVFNKEPKICYDEQDVDTMYGDASADLKEKLKFCVKYFPDLNIPTVVQGDLLFTSDVKEEEVEGEKLYTFTPNTITYGIPIDHPIGKKIKSAKIGIVFHTHYTGNELTTMTARGGAPTAQFTQSDNVLVVENDTEMSDVSVDTSKLKKFEANVTVIGKMCQKSGKFLDHLVENMGTSGDKKFHVASYLKQFFNAEIKASRSITDPKKALKQLGTFYHEKMNKEVSKMKSVQKQAERRTQLYDGLGYLEDNEQAFHAMFNLYRKIQENKTIVIEALDNLETFRTFVRTDKGYKVTAPEGYVLHHNGDMIKLVNRIEFSYINFTLAKQWR